ncbi:MAG: TolC family protein [Clostridiaceae bacterium]|nr:TolC family protein [Clostridiaceae bacterium]
MRKIILPLSIILCTALLLGNITAFADAMDDGVLTLEEAKELALKNDVNYKYQDDKIQDAKDNYAELSEDTSATSGRGSNIAQKEAARISQKLQLENAYSNVRKAVLNKADLKRSSDYEVTDIYYSVIEAQNSAASAQRDLDLKRNDLEKAQIKYDLHIINKASHSQAESAYRSSESTYNKAVSDLNICIKKLNKNIGEELDISKVKLDTILRIPYIKNLDLAKIKEDNRKNNLTYFSAEEQFKLAEYELALTEEKYEDHYEELKKGSSNVRVEFDNMLYDAEKKFEDAEYSFNEKLESLEETIEDQYESLEDLYESYLEQKEDIKDMELTVKENQVKNIMGIINKSDLDSSVTSLENMKYQLITTIINLNKQYIYMTQYSVTE